MATTFVDYTGDGNATKSFSFPSIKEADVKVEVDGVVKTTSTHYDITSYTTTGGGNVVFTSGNIPASPALIRIFRDTDVDTAKATYTAGSSVKAGDLNNNHEQLLFAAQEEQNQTVTTSGIKDAAVTTAKIKADNITSALIADDQINSEHYVDGSIDTAHIADLQVTTAKIAADAVTGAKIADDQINSEHYVDGSIDTAHIANSQITTDKLNNLAVTTAKITDANVTTAKIADSNVTTAKIADANVTTAKIADNAITMAKLNSGVLPTDVTVASANLVDGTIVTADIADNAVTMAKLNSGTLPTDITVASANLVNGTVDTVDLADNAVTTAKITDANITTAKIADNNITVGKIADGELKTLAGMQSGTASKLADSTALTADIADLNQIDGLTKQTTIADNDAHFPTSGAVVDYVAAQLEPFGGFEAIANEVSFPNTQPVSGVAVSIADATGIVVNGSGVSTTGRTVGGSTVTINGINSQFNSTTIASGVRFIVTSTGSGQVYNYHKATLAESDLVSLSGDINDFAERYRVGSSNPTSSLDNGDLFFNTSTGKLLVYNGTNSAWEEAQSIGNFFISTLSPAFDGTTQDFTLTNAPTNAQQVILSINGVVQKPNAGSSAPSEGFALTGSTVKLSAAPATGSTYHAVVMGSTVNIGTPSDNTVTTAILQNGSVTTAKIVDANVTTAKIADDAVTADKIANSINSAIAANTAKTTNATHTGDVTGATSLTIASGAVTTAKIADDAVTAAKLANTSVTAASYGSSTSIPSITVDAQGRITAASGNTVNTDLVGDTSPQLGGDLDTNSHHILLDDDHYVKFGDSSDLTIRHTAGANIIDAAAGQYLYINSDNLRLNTKTGAEKYLTGTVNGAVELYHDNTKRFETTANGVEVSAGRLDVGSVSLSGGGLALADNDKVVCGNGDDLQIYHDGSHNIINGATGQNLEIQTNAFRLRNQADSESMIVADADGAVELYHNNSKRFETLAAGTHSSGQTHTFGASGSVVALQAGGTNTDISLEAVGAGGWVEFKTTGTARWRINGTHGHFYPVANNTYDIGTSTYRVRNIYTNDLHLSNEGHSNDVDGTWGNWTIQEGESDLFLKNNRSGKKYKFNLTEVS